MSAELELLVREALARHGLAEHVRDEAVAPLAAFTALLMKHGKRTNLVGTTEPARLVDEVVVDALQVAPLLPDGGGTLLDVGSGAGIPGIPLAIVRPDWQVVTLEPREKRVLFQQTARRALGLGNLRVVEGRLEALPSAAASLRPSSGHGASGGALPTAAAPPSSGHAASGGGDRFDAAVTKAVWAADEWVERGRGVVRDGGVVLGFVNGQAPAGTVSRAYVLADGRRRAAVRLG